LKPVMTFTSPINPLIKNQKNHTNQTVIKITRQKIIIGTVFATPKATGYNLLIQVCGSRRLNRWFDMSFL
jgi:hypothetical protein